ncbi:MAG TPA: PEP-CTERM system TPR-repeat protein PrsT, partial [Burkholderiaceae bacterium]|nr:PEP-CTERM system TPR-repeat protein PrsT [Burkholderiaceae bacterium]
EKLAPRRPDVPSRLAGIAIEEGKLDDARRYQAELARLAPNHVMTHHLKAVIEARSGQVAAARDSVGEALRRAPDYLPSVALAAAVHLQLNELEQAERQARRLVDRQPTALQGYRLLGSTYLKMNAPERALEAVRRPLERGAADPMLLAIAGEASLKTNNPEAAEKYFEQATKLDPKDSRKLTGLAMSNLATGDRATAIDQLEAAVELDSTNLQADFVLITALTREGKFDQALAAVERAKQKAPKSPIPEMLRGGVFLAKNDNAAARRAWEQALALDPQHFPAVSNLSNADIRDGKRDSARKRYEDFVAAHPKSAQAWVALAQLAVIEQAPRARALELLKKARDADPASAMPVLATARYMMETDTAAEAVPLLQQAHNSHPDDLQVLDALAQAQLRDNQRGQAIATWERLLRTNPGAWGAMMRIGEVHRADGKNDLALASFVKAAEIAPNAIEPQVAMAATMHALGRKDEARRLADRLRAPKQNAFAGALLQGDLAAADNDWKTAADGYRRAFDQQKTVAAGTKLHRALRSAGEEKQAEAMLGDWLRAEPEILALRMYAGEFEISQQRWRQAWDHYKVVADAQPNNVLALNNGAWALHELKDRRAAEVARRAWEVAPKHPAVLDTYGVILSMAGDPKGLEMLREAVAAAPKNPQLRLHLAEALLRAGDKAGARSEVSTVLETAEAGPVADAAKALQAKL